MPKFPKATAAAAAEAIGGVTEGTDIVIDDITLHRRPRAHQWAMLTEDCGMVLISAYIDDQPVPEVFRGLLEKRIWLLEGNWGEHANLQRWADDMINTDAGASFDDGHYWATSIDTGFCVYKIKKTEWPAITEILPAGLQVLTRETFKAWCDALKNFCDGNVAEAETTLRNAGLMPA